MKKILILGVTSIIGYHFYQQNKDRYHLYGLCRNWPFDDSKKILSVENFDFNTIKNVINNTKPDILINCIGMNDVGKCESYPELSEKLNVELVMSLVSILNALNIKFISFSSSHVFSGNSEEYFEGSNTAPINTYGRQKMYSDNYIKKYSQNFLLLRLTAVIANKNKFQRNNLANFIIDNLSQNKPVTLVCDDCTNFIYVDDVVNVIRLLLDNYSEGLFNIAGDEMLSRYELGLLIMNKMKLKKLIKKVCSADYLMNVDQPKKLVLNNNKLKNEINYSFKSLECSINDLLKLKEG